MSAMPALHAPLPCTPTPPALHTHTLIPPRYGSIIDEASEALAAVRKERRDNLASLRTSVEELARSMWQRGVCEMKEASILRGRFCVGVKVRACQPASLQHCP
jgi:hypothetical protein